MIIYEVNLNVRLDIAAEYEAWLKEHIRQMLGFEGFLGAFWLEDTQPAEGMRCWVVQYRLRDRKSLDEYLEHHAAGMRRDGLERFPGGFTATRRILEGVEDIGG